jgi:hypothetical protein
VKEFFSIYLILSVALGPGVYSASSINEYQKQKIMFLGSRARPVHKTDNLTATVILDPTGTQTQPLGRPAHSHSLYRLRMSGRSEDMVSNVSLENRTWRTFLKMFAQ